MCMFEADGDGTVTVLASGNRKARKEHKCKECYREIQAGETYHPESYVFDGEFSHHKTCAHCMVARAWLLAECDGFLYGGILEDIEEHVTDGCYGYDLKVLASAMRDKWHFNGDLLPVPTMPKVTPDPMLFSSMVAADDGISGTRAMSRLGISSK